MGVVTADPAEKAPRFFDVEEAPPPAVYPTQLEAVHIAIGVGFLLVAAIASVLVGPADLAPGAVLANIADKLPFVHLHSGLSQTGAIVVWQLRMPRMVLGGLVGAMLAVAGASYQGVFSNPLADPYLLGIASGAGLGATLVIIDGPLLGRLPADALPVAAFAGGVVAVAATFALGGPPGGPPPRCSWPGWPWPPFSPPYRRSSSSRAPPATLRSFTAGYWGACRRRVGARW